MTTPSKVLAIFSLGLASFLVSFAASAATKRELVRDIIEPYEIAIQERYGAQLTLHYDSRPVINAGAAAGGGVDGGPQMIVFDGLLEIMENEEIVFVICHELGHLLGRVPLIRDGENLGINVEGEADYFGGKCAYEFFGQDEQRAVESARYSLAKLNRERTIAEAALCRNFDGVSMNYPEHDCRVLTAMHGARGLQRPSCWYNPKAR